MFKRASYVEEGTVIGVAHIGSLLIGRGESIIFPNPTAMTSLCVTLTGSLTATCQTSAFRSHGAETRLPNRSFETNKILTFVALGDEWQIFGE